MASNPLIINTDEPEKLSLEFSKENFSEFVFSLLATPRQERRVYFGGFDLTLAEAKALIDKIGHKLSTDHDIIHNDFVADIDFEDNTHLTLNSYDQLFSTQDTRLEVIRSANFTLSATVPFNRKNAEKSFEKQTISLTFFAGATGSLEVQIRSTEISWPAGYFALIDQHRRKLANDVTTHSLDIWRYVFFLHPLFDDFGNSNSGPVESPKSTRNSTLGSLTLGMLTVTTAFFLMLSRTEIPPNEVIFDPKSQTVQNVDITELVNDFGWQGAAQKIEDTRTLARTTAIDYGEGVTSDTLFSEITGKFYGKMIFSIGMLISILIFANFCYARYVAAARGGRILLLTDTNPPRPKGSFWPGLASSLAVGAVASLIATVISSLAQ